MNKVTVKHRYQVTLSPEPVAGTVIDCPQCKAQRTVENLAGLRLVNCDDHIVILSPVGVIREENAAPGYPADWPRCPSCGDFALDGHITCGRLECQESSYR